MSRGGKRPGAGAPCLEDESQRRIPVSIRLPRWLVDWLRDQEYTQSSLIESAIVQAYRLKRRDRK